MPACKGDQHRMHSLSISLSRSQKPGHDQHGVHREALDGRGRDPRRPDLHGDYSGGMGDDPQGMRGDMTQGDMTPGLFGGHDPPGLLGDMTPQGMLGNMSPGMLGGRDLASDPGTGAWS